MGTAKTVRLLAVGDIMLGDHPVCIGHGVRSQMEKRGILFPFQLVSSLLKQGDITFGNLEVALSDKGFDPNRLESAELRGKPVFAEALAAAGFNMLSVANNHSMQHGERPFRETIEVLAENGISGAGLGTNDGFSNVIEFSKHGVRIALVSYSLRQEKHYNGLPLYATAGKEKICSQVKDLSNSFDAVVVSLHWGEEYLNYPSQEQITLARTIVECGACLILGHHPHVLQGIEECKNGLIAYSLGNFVFDKWQRNPRETMILDVYISKAGIERWDWWPVFINDQYQPEVVEGQLGQEIRRKMYEYSLWIKKEVENPIRLHGVAYNKAARKAYLRFRLASYLYFLRNLYRYSPNMVKQSLVRAARRRKVG